MPLAFIDTNGNEGRIHHDLTVTYTGESDVAESIEEHVQRLRTDAESVDDVSPRLMFALIGEYGIRDIRRVEDGSRDGGSDGAGERSVPPRNNGRSGAEDGTDGEQMDAAR